MLIKQQEYKIVRCPFVSAGEIQRSVLLKYTEYLVIPMECITLLHEGAYKDLTECSIN